MPAALTQKAREEKEEQRVLKRVQEKRLKERGVQVVKPGYKSSVNPKTGYGSTGVHDSKPTWNPKAELHYHKGKGFSVTYGEKSKDSNSLGDKNKEIKKQGAGK